MMDAQEMLADDIEIGGRQEMMNVGDAPRHRIVDGDHREIGVALLDRGKSVLERARGHGFVVRIGFAARNMGVGARLALIGDFHCHLKPSLKIKSGSP
jgi:hypothetical protein